MYSKFNNFDCNIKNFPLGKYEIRFPSSYDVSMPIQGGGYKRLQGEIVWRLSRRHEAADSRKALMGFFRTRPGPPTP